jgi:hypothetical protein
MSSKNGAYFYSLMQNRDRMRFSLNVKSQEKCFDTIMKKKYDNFHDFLHDSFCFSSTLQGDGYWEAVCKQISSDKKIKTIDFYFSLIFFFIIVIILFLFSLKK